MVAKSLLLLSFVAAAIAEPIPQDSAAATTSFGGAAMTSVDTALPSSLSFLEACASSEESIYSGVPTLPVSVELAIATVVPTSLLTQTGCAAQTAIEGYYSSLPASVVSILSSYSSELQSWYDAHSSQLNALASSCSVSGSATYTLSSINVPICTNGAAQPGSTATGTTGGKTTATGGATTASTATGTSGSSTATGSGSGASTSKSTGMAAPTGAVTFGAAGVIGLLGFLVAL